MTSLISPIELKAMAYDSMKRDVESLTNKCYMLETALDFAMKEICISKYCCTCEHLSECSHTDEECWKRHKDFYISYTKKVLDDARTRNDKENQ